LRCLNFICQRFSKQQPPRKMKQNSNQDNHDSSLDIDLSKSNHRNERLKQKYDHSGSLIYTYGNSF